MPNVHGREIMSLFRPPPVGVRRGGGGSAVSEPHPHALAPLQERHQGGRGERGEKSIQLNGPNYERESLNRRRSCLCASAHL